MVIMLPEHNVFALVLWNPVPLSCSISRKFGHLLTRSHNVGMAVMQVGDNIRAANRTVYGQRPYTTQSLTFTGLMYARDRRGGTEGQTVTVP